MTTELTLQIKNTGGRSVIEDCYFTSPLKIGTPKREGDRILVVFMMASAGVLKGDSFQYEIVCHPNTSAHLTEQSYTKIFDTGDGSANKVLSIRLEKDASLYYHPCAVIPYTGSWFDADMQVELSADSEFACSDILTAGRIGMGERFGFTHYRSRICVRVEGVPVWLDHCLLEPQNGMLEQMYFFDGYTHQGVFFYYGSEEKMKILVSYETVLPVFYGITSAVKGICVRILAYTAQDIEDVFADIAYRLNLD